jgi:AAT family amino acid transporter
MFINPSTRIPLIAGIGFLALMTAIFYLLKMEKRVPLDEDENEKGTKTQAG